MHPAILFLFLISLPLQATVFQKQPITRQIQEADGIVMGHFLRSHAMTLDDGRVVTQMIIKMNKEVGLQSEMFGLDEVIIHYPGGTVGDKTVKIEGVPEFVPGENIVLMIKSSQDRFWGMNLGFGTFKVINYGSEKLIVNTIFPEDATVGQMKLEEFEEKVKTIKGVNFKQVVSAYPIESGKSSDARSPASLREGKNRAIASDSEEYENNQSQGMNTVWLLLSLALMGGIFRLLRQRTSI